MKKPLIIITGPTASGKSNISVSLAKKINGEIISADSMQVYKHMDIGTAKITKEEMQGVTHHLIDVLDPRDDFNVSLFKEYANNAIEDILSRNRIPIIAGGTGFYIQSVLYDTQFTEHETDTHLRNDLFNYAEKYGNEALHDKLKALDPVYAENVHFNNVKRVVRAIEYCTLTGQSFSEHNETEHNRTSPYNYAYFVLDMDRELLYDRINIRVDRMFDDGLLDEVRELKKLGLNKDMVSMKGLGYKEVLDYLDGIYTLDEAINIIKRETRHFAKRQLTWFRRENDTIWLKKTAENDDLLLESMIQTINEKGII
ncbi:MAG: tRNA (adenosine(37)-N6)-dimethylallyltransferase MiaA [Lachnospiraceae bacterium]|nr:tRNA (adenosine(37)-N6)-dimethylallyltransferase MiaA [Lachnospiraceae bacterium]